MHGQSKREYHVLVIAMKIRRISIKNFRSIKELDFSPNDLCVLIGQNNAGKSTVLRALNLALGDTWPTERQFSDEDFYNRDLNSTIEISVYFDETTTVWRNNKPCEVAGLRLSCKTYKRKTGRKLAGDLNIDYVCIDQHGTTLTYPEEPLQKGVKPKCAWLPLRASSDIRDKVAFIYVDVQRDYRRHSAANRWTILRRLFKDVQTKLATSKDRISEIDEHGGKQPIARLDAYKRRLNSAFEALKSADFEKVESLLEKHALDMLGLDADKDKVRLGFDPFDPENVFRALQLYVREGDLETAAEDVGAGLQSAIVIAIFRTYQELQREGAIFAIEEPEVFLHPHRARFFVATLRNLVESGLNQVFLSTHSPVFVPVDRYQDIAIVRKTLVAGTTVTQTGDLAMDTCSKDYLRLITEFDSQRSELFFASRVLLVEGYTERIVFPLVFRALGIDVNREAISVVECQGKTKMPLFAKILTALQIPFVVIHDDDVQEINPDWTQTRQDSVRHENTNHRKWNAQIADAVGDPSRVFVLCPKFEGICGLPNREDTKLQRALDLFSSAQRDAMPVEIIKPAERLLAL
jgi:putative ATP-dependent endonuclease of the OLD family